MRYQGFTNSEEPYDPSRYERIAKAAMDPSTPATEVTEAEYYHMQGCVPPISTPGGGWLVGEAATDCALGTVHAMYVKNNDRFYAKHVVRGRVETYIDAYAVARAYDIDRANSAWLEEVDAET